MPRKLAVVATLVLGCGLTQAACGDDANQSEGQVRSVLIMLSNTEPELCDHVTDRFIKESFRTIAACRSEAVKSKVRNQFSVKSVAVDGEGAIAVIRTPAGGPGAKLKFVRQDGDWKLDHIVDS